MKKILCFALPLLLILLLSACNKTTKGVETSSITLTSSATTKEEVSYEISSFIEDEYLIYGVEALSKTKVVTEVKGNGVSLKDPDISYSSSDLSVLKVGEDGTVVALSYGKATVTTTFNDGTNEYSSSNDVYVFEKETKENINAFNGSVNLFGRTYMTGSSVTLDNPATAIEIWFYGSSLSVNLKGSNGTLYFRSFVDSDTEGVMTSAGNGKNADITLCEGLDMGIHSVRLVKSSSPDNGKIYINSFDTDGDFLKTKPKSDLKIEFIGDSITVGFGNLGMSTVAQSTANSDSSKSYAYLTAQQLDADYSIIALEGICIKDTALNMVTYYEDLSTTNKTQYNPSDFDADIVVIAMGENDMWHATDKQFSYNLDSFIKDYTDFLKTVRKYHENAYIICIYGMMPASSKVEAKTSIQKAIEDSGLTNITSIQMACNTSGSGEHPNLKGHQGYMRKIVNDLTKNYFTTE